MGCAQDDDYHHRSEIFLRSHGRTHDVYCVYVPVVRLESWLSQNDILVYSLVGLQLGIQLSNVHGWLHHVAPAAPRGSAAIYSSSKGWVSRVVIARFGFMVFGFMVGRFGGCVISQLSSLTGPPPSLQEAAPFRLLRLSPLVGVPWVLLLGGGE